MFPPAAYVEMISEMILSDNLYYFRIWVHFGILGMSKPFDGLQWRGTKSVLKLKQSLNGRLWHVSGDSFNISISRLGMSNLGILFFVNRLNSSLRKNLFTEDKKLSFRWETKLDLEKSLLEDTSEILQYSDFLVKIFIAIYFCCSVCYSRWFAVCCTFSKSHVNACHLFLVEPNLQNTVDTPLMT